MFPVDAFREVQHESTEKLSQHLLQLQTSMSEANELHRQQLNILRQLMLQQPAGKEQQSTKTKKVVDIDKSIHHKSLFVPAGKTRAPVSGTSMVDQVSSAKLQVEISAGSMFQKLKALSAESAKFLEEELPLDVHCGHHITWGGRFGDHKILDYDLNKLSAYAAFPLVFSSAAIFRLRKSLSLQMFCQVVLMAVLTVAVHLARDGRPLADDLAFHSSPYGKCFKFVNDALQRLVPFVLALFISLHLRRWWAIRSCYLQKIHTSTMQISLQLGLVLPPSTERFRIRIERYLLASHKLIFACARQRHLDSVNFDHLVDTNVMTKDEVNHVRSSTAAAPEKLRKEIGACDMAVAGIPVTWAAQLIYRIFMASKNAKQEIRFDFPVNMMVQLLGQCVTIRKEIQDIEMMLTSPLPFPYVQLVASIVHAMAIFSCIEAGVFMGCSEVNIAHYVFHSIGVIILNGLYLGVLWIAVLLTNPFTEECVDFPATNLHCRMIKTQIFSRHVCYADEAVDDEIYKELEKQAVPEAPARCLIAENQCEDDSDECDDDDDDGDEDGENDEEAAGLEFL